jgi:thiosulfate dehydrogenase [quinone] large subunit
MQEDTMTATGPLSKNPVLRTDDAFLAEPVHEETPRHTAYRYTLAATRIALGWVFLWAFLDKTFALGFHTGYDEKGSLDRFGDAAWINGGSPTEGFLKFGADGPFKEFYNSIAGSVWADWLFMLGLLGIGLALTFGIGMRVAATAGFALYLMMWTVVLPPENHPFIDDHILGAISMVVLAAYYAGDTWGFGKAWASNKFVKDNPVLR